MDSPETTTRAGATVAASDIARLADVGRAAVSNWRRRYPDFPQPVGGSTASPLYSLVEVEAWLTRHGKEFHVAPGDRVWQRVRGAVDDLQLGDLVAYLGAFLVFLKRDPRRWQALSKRPDAGPGDLIEAIVDVVPELPDRVVQRPDGDWADLIRLTADAAGRDGHREVFEFLCERYLEVLSRRVPVTPAPIVDLMVDLADVGGRTVFDPACGLGSLLLAGQLGGAAAVCGQEIVPVAAGIAAVRLLLRDGGDSVAVGDSLGPVACGDSLRADAFAGRAFDTVVCNPPFNERSWGFEELAGDPRWEFGIPPRGEPELAWVQHCLAHIGVNGRVVIMMPAPAASRRSGRRIRSELLRKGALAAVISLPTAWPAAGTAPDLWVLRRPANEPLSRVLMVDASSDLSIATRAWRSFLRDPDTRLPDGSRAVRVIDLLDDEVDVSPARHLARRTADAAQFQPTRDRLLSTTGSFGRTLPDLVTSPDDHAPATTTVGDLIKAGIVATFQAPIRMVTDAGDTPVLTVRDVRHGRPPSGLTTPGPGAVVVAPGDVVVPMTARDGLPRVVTDGGAILGPQLLLLRVDPDRLDPHFLAGFLRVAQTVTAARASLGSSRTDVRRAALPRLSLADQRGYGEAFVKLAEFEDQLRSTVSLGETLLRLGFAGLADGSLRPQSAE
ncbi:MAG TPA: N-6 DNA methylase [Micromonosporaceae bacterium]